MKLVVEKELFTRLRDSDFNKLLKLVDSISDYKLVDNNKNVEDTTVPLVINDGGDIIDTNDSLKTHYLSMTLFLKIIMTITRRLKTLKTIKTAY